MDAPDAVRLPSAALSPYPRFSLYNSPYAAHGRGRAVDLYPGDSRAYSPVAGTVRDVRSVRAPPKPYAPDCDGLVIVACDDDSPGTTGGRLARFLHIDPTVEPGQEVAVGDDLGPLVRAGFFAPWVDRHLHVGFRHPDDDPYRASGSLPLSLGVEPRPIAWDGTGGVVETGDTYALLDAPSHPDPGAFYVGIGADAPERPSASDAPGSILDGGLRHYDGGGLFGGLAGPVSLLGTRIGRADGRTVDWTDVGVFVDGQRITGLSLFCARDDGFGAKLICPDATLAVGDDVRVSIRPVDDPIVLG
jgi:hypothetical protein